jgi:hypothetical protein
MKRAIRRHHRERLKRNRKSIWGYEDKTPLQLGVAVDTPKRCSCFMCGNERKYFNRKTRKECMNDITFMEEVCER